MKIPVNQLKPGMLVHISHYRNAYAGDVEFHNMRVHAYIPKEQGVVFECGESAGKPAVRHSWKSICEQHGYPMDPNKNYIVFCSEYRRYYSATLDKSAISSMLVTMYGG